jgi:hypothetical protein
LTWFLEEPAGSTKNQSGSAELFWIHEEPVGFRKNQEVLILFFAEPTVSRKSQTDFQFLLCKIKNAILNKKNIFHTFDKLVVGVCSWN